jgi:hypothetical protein
MDFKQISVFLENTAGRLGEITRVLARAEVNIRAISIADTSDFGILRLIVQDCDKAVAALKEAGYTTRVSDVLAVEIDDVPGSLAKVMALFETAKVNIEYLYASLEGKAGKAVVIFKLEDNQKGMEIVEGNKLSLINTF